MMTITTMMCLVFWRNINDDVLAVLAKYGYTEGG